MKKGESGKSYHVKKELKRKKKREKERNNLFEKAYLNALQRRKKE
jgi:hypothetical protein